MSSTLPPSQPPQQPGQSPYAAGTPEILDASEGTTIGGSGRRGGGRRGLLIGGGVLGLAVVGGGAWAAFAFFATGAQPAEALPASTLGYASIDLDPSGGQKIEAVRTLNKFPKLKDTVGLDADDDLAQSIFDAISDASGGCKGLDYADDIKPWLGSRAAVAAVKDADGEPQPVLVVQVTDADAADKGLATIAACGGESDADTGWVIDGDWATIAPTKALATRVSDDAADDSLADDPTYQKWTGEAGDAGVVTMYAAPGAGPAILSGLGEDLSKISPDAEAKAKDFEGAAASLRFADGSLELEVAAGAPKGTTDVVGSSVGDQVASLPDDTAAAIGISFGKDWFATLLDGFASGMDGTSTDDLVSQFEEATGLRIPEDVETLTGDSVVLSVAPGIDPEALVNSADPTDVPVGLKLHGDADEIEAVLAKIRAAIPVPELSDVLASSASGDTVVVSPDDDYRAALVKDGGLGDSTLFKRVVTSQDSPAIFYVDLDSFDSALKDLLGDDPELVANLEPLAAVGFSSSVDGDVTHGVLRIATDD